MGHADGEFSSVGTVRLSVSLSRLRQGHSKTAEARELPSLIYNWFTEGFDTKDLQEAKALLGELG